MAEASKVTLRLRADVLPELPGARDAWNRGVRTGGAERNVEFLQSRVEWSGGSDFTRALAIDPQTSGGLLVAVPPARVAEYLSLVHGSVEVGDVVPRQSFGLVLA